MHRTDPTNTENGALAVDPTSVRSPSTAASSGRFPVTLATREKTSQADGQ